MRRLVFSIFLLLAACATAPPTPEALLSDMRALEAQRGAAIREGDTATLERIYAGDFVGVNAAGVNVSRARTCSRSSPAPARRAC